MTTIIASENTRCLLCFDTKKVKSYLTFGMYTSTYEIECPCVRKSLEKENAVLREYFEACEAYNELKLCDMTDGRYDSQPVFDRREKAALACYELFKEEK